MTDEGVRVDESVLWYAALGHLIDEVVFVHREDRSIAFVSPSVEHVLGYTVEEFTHLSTPELIHPDELAEVVDTAIWLREEPGRSYRSTLRIRTAAGAWRWVEVVGRNLLHEPSVGGVVNTLRDISDRRALEERLVHQATHDDLTGLANRAQVLDELERVLGAEPPGSVALLYLDLDGFKAINDTYGHVAGDGLLRVVAERLRSVTRTRDLAGRLGGDEFVVICLGIDDDEAARAIGERVHAAVSGPTTVGDRVCDVRLSLGVARSPDVADADGLVHEADRALYRAKGEGRNRVVLLDGP